MISNFKTPLYHCLAFSVVFSYLYLFLPFSLEVTDAGFNLYNQMAAFKGFSDYDFGILWLSDWLGGLWLYLTSSWGYYGATLGWASLTALLGVISFRFMRLFIKPQLAILLLAPITVAFTLGRIRVPSYTLFEALFLTLAAWFLLCFFDNTNKIKGGIKALLFSLFVVLAVMARFPGILAWLFFPLFACLLELSLLKRSPANALKDSFKLYGSLIFATTLIFLAMTATGVFLEYWESIYRFLGFSREWERPSHFTFSQMLSNYWLHFTWRLPLAAFYTVLFFLPLGVLRLLKDRKNPTLSVITMLITTIGSTYLALYQLQTDTNELRVLYASFLIISSIVSILIILLVRDERIKKAEVMIRAISFCLFAALVSVAGSSVGFINFIDGAWPLFGLILTVPLFLVAKQTKQNYIIYYSFFPVIALAYNSVSIQWTQNYREMPYSANLNTPINHSKFNGILTTKSKAESFGGFLKKLDDLTQENEETLLYNSIPLVHWATQTSPYLGHVWPTMQGEKGVKKLIERNKRKTLPQYAARALTNTQSVTWGNGRIIPPHNPEMHKATLHLDKWLFENKYAVIWKNDDFAIFKRKELD